MKTVLIYALMTTVLPHVAELALSAFALLAAQESFIVIEQTAEHADLAAIEVHWEPIPGLPIGQAWCKCFHHLRNRIVIDSTYAWASDADIRWTILHEAAHIIFATREHVSSDLWSVLYPRLLGGRERLSWDDQRRMVEVFGQVRPIPPMLVSPNAP